jgi:hypothetical protein
VILTSELPATFAAVLSGRTSEWRAEIVARETIFSRVGSFAGGPGRHRSPDPPVARARSDVENAAMQIIYDRAA